MLRLEHTGRRFALLVVGSLLAGACSQQDLAAPTAEFDVAPAAASPAAKSLTFRGEVTTVNEAEQAFVLSDGTRIQMTGQTRIPPGSDVQSLDQLSVLVQQQDAQIQAQGRGEIVSTQPLVLSALQVNFRQR